MLRHRKTISQMKKPPAADKTRMNYFSPTAEVFQRTDGESNDEGHPASTSRKAADPGDKLGTYAKDGERGKKGGWSEWRTVKDPELIVNYDEIGTKKATERFKKILEMVRDELEAHPGYRPQHNIKCYNLVGLETTGGAFASSVNESGGGGGSGGGGSGDGVEGEGGGGDSGVGMGGGSVCPPRATMSMLAAALRLDPKAPAQATLGLLDQLDENIGTEKIPDDDLREIARLSVPVPGEPGPKCSVVRNGAVDLFDDQSYGASARYQQKTGGGKWLWEWDDDDVWRPLGDATAVAALERAVAPSGALGGGGEGRGGGGEESFFDGFFLALSIHGQRHEITAAPAGFGDRGLFIRTDAVTRAQRMLRRRRRGDDDGAADAQPLKTETAGVRIEVHTTLGTLEPTTLGPAATADGGPTATADGLPSVPGQQASLSCRVRVRRGR